MANHSPAASEEMGRLRGLLKKLLLLLIGPRSERRPGELITRDMSAEDVSKLYEQVCVNIRTTDDISFKLLGLVPLASGSGIVVLLSTNTSFSRLPLVVFVAVFGLAVTYGLYRWELRNIQTCDSLIALACDLERDRGLAKGQFLDRPTPPKVLGLDVGKTEAERLIYRAAISAWFLLPFVAAILAAFD
jgi:hypothetical protein